MTAKSAATNNIESIYPLSPMQQGLLYETLYSKSGEYFQQLSHTIKGRLNAEALKCAWERVVERHPALRTLFLWERYDSPLQVVRKQVNLPWSEYDWRNLPQAEQEDRLQGFLRAERELGFELTKAPLMRLTLFHLADETYEFVWSHHHILMDGWSGALIRNEVYAFYDAIVNERDLRLGQPRPYKHYISWLQQQDLSQAEAFWSKMLKGFKKPIPLGSRISHNPVSKRKEYDVCGTMLSDKVTASLQTLARQNRLTVNTLMQGVWSIILWHCSKETDLVFGSVVSGRPPEIEGVESMVGVFINTLPVRMQIDLEASLLSWLQDHQSQQIARQRFEYSPLVDVQRWSEVPHGQPLFESILVFQSYPQEMPRGEKGNAQENALEFLNPRAMIRNNYPLTFRAIPGAGLQLQLLYDINRFEFQTIMRMLRNLETLIMKMLAQIDSKLKEFLQLVEEADRQQRAVEEKDFKESRKLSIRKIKRNAIEM